ncbi:N-acetylmuramoyl-L-alanine amidase [Fulvivirgaceae bacterium BMA10]|uniref:N-acetylmuramoyl-L-alanine amidase n=1 Tax=Splendidivirga corallicola TaxID=3051826 RepID=A0ABT8KQC9_9BACT|nr:N-acetylmuramoyl-L-alanine amidase [Fulvivirgaceae bacterium BMA10]
MKLLNILFLLGTLLLFGSFQENEKNSYQLKTIVIDAGHGGKDPGCQGKISFEKNVALAVALELGRILNENLPDIKVIYTRKKDHFVELHERANIANKNEADLFISIHCNAGPHYFKGSETYAMGLHKTEGNLEVAKRENQAILIEENYSENYDGFDPESPEAYILFSLLQNAFLDNSLNIAGKIEGQFKNRVQRHSRGVKQAGFVVLWRTSMPSVLVELGFLTNPDEEKYLNQKKNQVYMASAIYRAIKEYKKELETVEE